MRGPFLRFALGLANLQSSPQSQEIAEQDRLWRGDDLRSHLSIQKELLAQTISLGRLDIPTYAIAINTPKDFDYAVWSEHLKIICTDLTVTHSRRKVEIAARDLFEQLSPDAKRFLRNN